MATRRTTFGKLERERQKREKAAAKRERRASLQAEDEAAPAPQTHDEGAVLDALAEVHKRYDDGELDLEEFELRRDELRAKLIS